MSMLAFCGVSFFLEGLDAPAWSISIAQPTPPSHVGSRLLLVFVVRVALRHVGCSHSEQSLPVTRE